MSKVPRDETQLLRDPVSTTDIVLLVLQSVVPLSGPAAPTTRRALPAGRSPLFGSKG